jgi:ATP-dependent DNA helicase RecG
MIEHLKGEAGLDRPLSTLRSVGDARRRVLGDHGLTTVLDLLFYLPVRYQDRRAVTPLALLKADQEAFVTGKVCGVAEEFRKKAGKTLMKITIEDDTGRLELIWFNYNRAYMKSLGRKGASLSAYGRVRPSQKGLEMVHPEILGPSKQHLEKGIIPVYRPLPGVGGAMIRGWILSLLDASLPLISDPVPSKILSELGLPGLAESLEALHRPVSVSYESLRTGSSPFHRRLLFNRFFSLTLSLAYRRHNAGRPSAPLLVAPGGFLRTLESALSFTLTSEQVSALEEIASDLAKGVGMNRLVQGEVGCGKTVLAIGAAYIASVNGWQSALMVPTRILATQHHEYISRVAGALGLRPCLVSGGMSGRERSQTERLIETGERDLVIGTHAILNESLRFKRLGLVIFDEQHRFGVRQRWALSSRGINPHILTMTATPIPRSLALALYADRDISIIRGLPDARMRVKTVCAGPDKKVEVFLALKDAVERGEQALIICPVIEETEEGDLKGAIEMAEALERLFPASIQVGLLHGRLPSAQKDLVMERFRSGAINILVATTVVEVGVHVPRASVMIIEHPERFGLAQLHQLRGRVGRDGSGGTCFLMVRDGIAPASLERIRAFSECLDGFEIASRDLLMRRQGELSGIRQSGGGDLDIEEMMREPDLFNAAKLWAERVVLEDPLLEREENRNLRKVLSAATN